jgi:hypothetical protein
VLPYIEQDNVYRHWDLRLKNSVQTQAARESQIKTLRCPRADRRGRSAGLKASITCRRRADRGVVTITLERMPGRK